MQVILNKKEKEELVVKLHQENKTIRQIAEAAHVSFGDIGKIIKRRIDGQTNDDDINLSNKSKATQALHLFKNGKKPIDVAIGLDLSVNEVHDLQQEFWALNQLDELALVYYEIKNHLDLFLKLFHIMKKNKSINQRDIQTVLRYAVFDIPSLESEIIDLEFKKKDLNNTITLQRAQLSDLGQAIIRYQEAIDSKQQQLMK